jgi:hypothetical protein
MSLAPTPEWSRACCDNEKESIWTAGESGLLDAMELLSRESASFIDHGLSLWAVLEHKEKLSWLRSSSSWDLEAKCPWICLDCEWSM